ncbi:SMI1/KNR4 family protein [Hymenobacter sp. DH14]|uniref:SMI1/KNR4 family protein n=1 Tax=Hymenobacter cyanobacteriorum TaxID=2926463 RepID=A0A9X2AFM6_9BACT|nr:SMI1/KNR4 family protein [Hymenobacter cyanobacteriorum]MCI1188002.1 SMI1/KNR4 family protein [Hymenobacter cyanobacteriorum]
MLEIVDSCLQWMVNHRLNNIPLPVHPAMAAWHPSPYADDGYESWIPIASTVTNQQLNDLEASINYALPADYRCFLQHKHFYELLLGDAEFFPHPIGEWQQILLRQVLTNWPLACQQMGLIPFASWGGAGDLLCFSANSMSPDYPVVLWNHEDWSIEDFSPNFTSLLDELATARSLD